MSNASQEVLRFFDALSEEEKHEVYVEILRRAEQWDDGEIDHDRLADELFVEMDRAEAQDAKG